jgi:NAD-dependent SIR2 family protein deacetylase
MNPLDERFVKAVKLVREAPYTTAFTGAGISDFRDPGGVWDRYRIVTHQECIGYSLRQHRDDCVQRKGRGSIV